MNKKIIISTAVIILIFSIMNVSFVKGLDVNFTGDRTIEKGNEGIVEWKFSNIDGSLNWEIYEDEGWVKSGISPIANYTILANHSEGIFNFTIYANDDSFGTKDSVLVTIKKNVNDVKDDDDDDDNSDIQAISLGIYSLSFIFLSIVSLGIISKRKLTNSKDLNKIMTKK